MPLSGAASTAACSNDPVQRHGCRRALEFIAAALLRDEQAGPVLAVQLGLRAGAKATRTARSESPLGHRRKLLDA